MIVNRSPGDKEDRVLFAIETDDDSRRVLRIAEAVFDPLPFSVLLLWHIPPGWEPSAQLPIPLWVATGGEREQKRSQAVFEDKLLIGRELAECRRPAWVRP